MTPQEIQKMTDTIAEKLRPWAEGAARNEARNVLGSILNVDDPSLRDRVDAYVTKIIRDKISRTMWVEVKQR